MKISVIIISAALLSGCAGSASHMIISSHSSKDYDLSCAEIDIEMEKAQKIIDGVNDDKNDINAADIFDGLMWFPFNLLAKSENYKNAIKASDNRIKTLHALKKEYGCDKKTDKQ